MFHGIALELAAILFNAVWDYAGRRQRLLGTTVNSSGARAIRRRFLALLRAPVQRPVDPATALHLLRSEAPVDPVWAS